jgi:hypothetical protein
MANNFNYSIAQNDVQQAPGVVWLNVTPPAYGSRLNINGQGEPTQGGFCAGTTEGAINMQAHDTIEEQHADQEPAPVGVKMTAQAASIAMTLREATMQKILQELGSGIYSAGVDSTLPVGAQSYEQMDWGGLVVIPTTSVAVISWRSGTNNPSKFFVFMLYKAYGSGALDMAFSLKKESTYKVTFKGLADTTRPQGYRVCQFFRQD